jgi:phosphatidylserine decarboxylase
LRFAREGVPFIIVPALLGLVTVAVGFWYVAIVFIIVFLFMVYFFRDPQRNPPADPDVVVSPADGRVTRVERVEPNKNDSATVVSIFLSPFDVHINRAPIAGTITEMSYVPGKFLMATNEKASLVNEQNVLTIEGQKATVVCRQIAGILARRVVCWKKKGDNLTLGERFGLIKFSSRTDVVLPANVTVTVAEGTRVQGGTTVIGKIS